MSWQIDPSTIDPDTGEYSMMWVDDGGGSPNTTGADPIAITQEQYDRARAEEMGITYEQYLAIAQEDTKSTKVPHDNTTYAGVYSDGKGGWVNLKGESVNPDGSPVNTNRDIWPLVGIGGAVTAVTGLKPDANQSTAEVNKLINQDTALSTGTVPAISNPFAGIPTTSSGSIDWKTLLGTAGTALGVAGAATQTPANVRTIAELRAGMSPDSTKVSGWTQAQLDKMNTLHPVGFDNQHTATGYWNVERPGTYTSYIPPASVTDSSTAVDPITGGTSLGHLLSHVTGNNPVTTGGATTTGGGTTTSHPTTGTTTQVVDTGNHPTTTGTPNVSPLPVVTGTPNVSPLPVTTGGGTAVPSFVVNSNADIWNLLGFTVNPDGTVDSSHIPHLAAGGQIPDVNRVHGALSQAFSGPVKGADSGQSDLISAKLSSGEYVMDAESVSALGDGNTEAGVAKLDELRRQLRAQKRSAPVDGIPEQAKGPLSYIGAQ